MVRELCHRYAGSAIDIHKRGVFAGLAIGIRLWWLTRALRGPAGWYLWSYRSETGQKIELNKRGDSPANRRSCINFVINILLARHASCSPDGAIEQAHRHVDSGAKRPTGLVQRCPTVRSKRKWFGIASRSKPDPNGTLAFYPMCLLDGS